MEAAIRVRFLGSRPQRPATRAATSAVGRAEVSRSSTERSARERSGYFSKRGSAAARERAGPDPMAKKRSFRIFQPAYCEAMQPHSGCLTETRASRIGAPASVRGARATCPRPPRQASEKRRPAS